jgi:hypothetical protein
MQKKHKTKINRINEIIKIKKKLNNFGLTEQYPGIKEFYIYCRDYVDNNNGKSGKIKLLGLKRDLHYKLSISEHINCDVILKYNKYT